jgi:hypothetical protein
MREGRRREKRRREKKGKVRMVVMEGKHREIRICGEGERELRQSRYTRA